MQEYIGEQELQERLQLIERMIAEGRRATESWGWTFFLWGLAYYVAIAWSELGHSAWSWPVTISIAVLLTVVLMSRKTHHQPETTLGRAIASIWLALGISMFLLFLALGFTGRLTDMHVFAAVISAILGLANGASALILRWRLQFACAVVWWVAAAAVCFGSGTQSLIVFLIAIFLCQIAFGLYGMYVDAHARKRLLPRNA